MSELPWDKIVLALLGALAARGEVAQHGARADAEKQYAASVQVTASVYDTLLQLHASDERRIARLEDADRAGRRGAGQRRASGTPLEPPPRDPGLMASVGRGVRSVFGWLFHG